MKLWEDLKEFIINQSGKIAFLSGVGVMIGLGLAIAFPPTGILYGVALVAGAVGLVVTGEAGGVWLANLGGEEKKAQDTNRERESKDKDLTKSVVGRMSAEIEIIKGRQNVQILGIEKLDGNVNKMHEAIDAHFTLQQQSDASNLEIQNEILDKVEEMPDVIAEKVLEGLQNFFRNPQGLANNPNMMFPMPQRPLNSAQPTHGVPNTTFH